MIILKCNTYSEMEANVKRIPKMNHFFNHIQSSHTSLLVELTVELWGVEIKRFAIAASSSSKQPVGARDFKRRKKKSQTFDLTEEYDWTKEKILTSDWSLSYPSSYFSFWEYGYGSLNVYGFEVRRRLAKISRSDYEGKGRVRVNDLKRKLLKREIFLFTFQVFKF